MTRYILSIYDLLARHGRWCLVSLLALTVVLVTLVARLGFKEDVSAFLPLDDQQQDALAVYQDISGASKIVAIFQHRDTTAANPDDLVEAIGCFEEMLADLDTARMVRDVVTQFDLEKVNALTDFVYRNIPYFLTDEDYRRMDSLLQSPSYFSEQLDEDKQLLMFPTSGFLAANLQQDPLNLFSPVVAKLRRQGMKGVETYDGYVFTADMSRAIALMESPFGNSETRNNAVLMNTLQQVADSVNARCAQVSLHYIGGPAIAVANATQIKADSVLSITIALVLIVVLLLVVFRRLWNILLIVVSVGWGWLFAMAMLAVVHDEVSLIVIGISSIILGIAVNYPLHLIAHASHVQTMRQALREVVSPLIIGNITTVGAFMALIPLRATALRDLGFFSAFILVGTILFVVFFLPHAVKVRQRDVENTRVTFLDGLSNLTLEDKRWAVVLVVAFTAVFAFFSLDTRFDANMSHINYMTEEQRADMMYFKQFTSGETNDVQCVYVVSDGATLDEALDRSRSLQPSLDSLLMHYDGASLSSCCRFLPSRGEQARRLNRWRQFVETYGSALCEALPREAMRHGFQPDAFDAFYEILSSDYAVQDFAYFTPLRVLHAANLSVDSLRNVYRVVDAVYVPSHRVEEAKAELTSVAADRLCFDVPSMNSALADSLSDNFNYIGWACGLIVFFFLWFSFGSIELALLSFLPMAVSWIWILGIMTLTHIQFNIVNIILATFIFGQGDDYTIFMTEGCCYEYAYRRRMLASYKRSIIVSALIMFIGIGTLIFARHPALHSLAEVTIVGMFSVVLMAYLLPPLVFKWMTTSGGTPRRRPLTLVPLCRTLFCGAFWLLQLLVGYVMGAVVFGLFRSCPRVVRAFRRLVTACHRFDVRFMPGVRIRMHNPHDERLDKPCVIVCNHQSLLDPMFFMAWSSQLVIVANERASLNPVVRTMFRWLDYYTIRQSNFTAWKDSSLERDMEVFRRYVAKGYSIVIFPEGLRNAQSSIYRCHKGPAYLAQQLGVDLLPVLLHGVNNVMPVGSFACHRGEVNMHIGARIPFGGSTWSNDCGELTRRIHNHMKTEYGALRARYETAAYFAPLVIDRYRYKGTEVLREVKRNLREHANYTDVVDRPQPDEVILRDVGYGELPLLMALVHPEVTVIACEEDDERRTLAMYAAEGVVKNVKFVHAVEHTENEITHTEDGRR
ncbi:MAG: 1-acyl-sn-glycerol-3-phosphate acyltransferase [Bacteroidaceae bacterium]|nr:1-acyl-sn-glycerol-3-phosphate acyltransferase [Bacteroidaceae bacterium]